VSATTAFIIRSACAADLAAIQRIELQSFVDPWSRAALAGELLPDRLRLPLVAEREGAVIGYLMAWRVVDQLHVLNLAVRSDWRRSGIGTALLMAAAGAARREGLTEITLEVRRGNRTARAFYARRGFAEIGGPFHASAVFPFGKGGAGGRQVVYDPVHPRVGPGVFGTGGIRIVADQDVRLGFARRAGPRKGWGDVFALAAVGVFFGNGLARVKGRALNGDGHGSSSPVRWVQTFALLRA